jgi:formylglycine-generating enzyme
LLFLERENGQIIKSLFIVNHLFQFVAPKKPFMKTLPHSVAMLFVMATPLFAAWPVVSSIGASQRAGTELVDIHYAVTADTPTVSVTLEISADGGVTWSVPVTTVSGNIGSGVTTGSGKMITWNAGVDWPGQFSAQTRYRVTADDLVAAPVLTGFSLIPAGAFTMGNALTESEGDPDETAHTVNVSAFYMAQNVVTKSIWDTVRTWAMSNGYTDLSSGAVKALNHPVQSVSWWDVVKWCNARSQQEGLTPVYKVNGAVMKTGTTAPEVNESANGYRLPTEAEWEKAARGGLSGKRFPWGDAISHSQANYISDKEEAYDVSPTNGYHPLYGTGLLPYTSSVASFSANGYGLHDMAGNVNQWCWDWYGPYATGTLTNPQGPISGLNRVFRGGSWLSNSYGSRTAYRNYNPPGITGNDTGFRLARSLVQ